METTELCCARCKTPMDIVRYRCDCCDLTIEGSFPQPPLAKLSIEEQAFVVAFVRTHGNIKKMERLFGISYPTVKSRLNAIARKLDAPMQVRDDAGDVIDRLDRGEISVDEALSLLEAGP